MNNIKYIYVVLFSLFIVPIQAQEKLVEKVTKKNYDNLAYIKTSEVLLEVAEEGHKSSDLFQKLGNSFYFNNKMEDAAKWYGELMALENASIDPEYYFRYAQALKGIENYEASDKWMTKFKDTKPTDLRARAFTGVTDYLSKIDHVSYEDLELKNLDINSELSDFGAAVHEGNLIFASSRGEGELYKWNEQPYLDLYISKKDEKGAYVKASKFDDLINTKYHESSVAYTPNGKYIYFTRNNYFKNKYREDDKKFNRLKLYRADVTESGNLENLTSIHFNSDDYSVAHPTINSSGTKLYFASDMPGTIGLSDIYVVDIHEDGSLGDPENLGVDINTEGSETFPFINEEGDLYYSSSGYPGLGGLDIYVIEDFENTYASKSTLVAQNIGKPFNSSQDDFGYYENVATQEGFFTSNREGGKGDDDIYSFAIPECKQLIEGVVKDVDTQDLLVGSKVILFDATGREIASKIVGDDAQYSFELSCSSEYLVRGSKQRYSTAENRFMSAARFDASITQDLLLKKDVQEIKVGDDLAKTLDIPIIYFDFDKHHIRPDAALELQKVIAVLKQYPSMTLDVRSHTDSRAPNSYNDALSERRNKSTINHIIKKGGIDPGRLTGRGYGETQLVNGCSDGVSCTEEAHQLNRRSEFIIVKM